MFAYALIVTIQFNMCELLFIQVLMSEKLRQIPLIEYLVEKVKYILICFIPISVVRMMCFDLCYLHVYFASPKYD
jgi:hypothetical protein